MKDKICARIKLNTVNSTFILEYLYVKLRNSQINIQYALESENSNEKYLFSILTIPQ